VVKRNESTVTMADAKDLQAELPVEGIKLRIEE